MSDEIPIGPNRCYACGGEYGEHAEDCRELLDRLDANKASKAASQRVVAAVLRVLGGRKGFSWWWGEVRQEDRDDIIKTAEKEVQRVL